MLEQLIERHGVDCRLVNTGWTGGPYGEGRRMRLDQTRALIRAALDGSLARGRFRTDPQFGLSIPEAAPGIAADVLDPAQGWADKGAYQRMARELARRFEANFAQFEASVGADVRAAAIRAAA